MEPGSIILMGALASLIAGAATGLGALPMLVMERPSEARQNELLGFAAGVMLAASFFSLILPAIDIALEDGMVRWQAASLVAAAVLIGAAALASLNRLVPSLEDLGIGPTGIAGATLRRIWLFVVAITLHNFPEGMAVGVSFGTGDWTVGQSTALGIGIQNMPEGLAVAVALMGAGYSRTKSVLFALLTGLVEPIGGLFGVTLVTFASTLLPWGLGFSAGAMIYVVTSDMIPHAYAEERGRGRISVGFMIGLVAMMFLDVSLGA